MNYSSSPLAFIAHKFNQSTIPRTQELLFAFNCRSALSHHQIAHKPTHSALCMWPNKCPFPIPYAWPKVRSHRMRCVKPGPH